MKYTEKFECRQWTVEAKNCYQRGCNCNGCELKTMLETKCLMKHTVLELVKKFGKPPEQIGRSTTQDDVLYLIKEGYNSAEAIAEKLGKSVSQIRNYIHSLYDIARGKEFNYQGRKKDMFPVFVDWVRNGGFEQ